MKKSFYFFLPILALFLAIFVLVDPVSAQSGNQIGLNYARESGLPETDVRFVVIRLINMVLGLLGIVTTVIIIYAGLTWLTSGGNDEKINKAKKTLGAATIGLVLVMMSYTISRFILTSSYRATTGRPYVGQQYELSETLGID